MNKKIFLIIFGALFLPLMVGVLASLMSIKDAMLHSEPKPLEKLSHPLNENTSWLGTKPKALILLGQQATSTYELLSTFEILSESGFEVKVAGFKSALHSLTSSIGIYPDGSLEKFQSVDLLVIPSFVGPPMPLYQAQISELASEARWVLLHGEGALALAASQQLDSKEVCSSALGFDAAVKQFPKVNWVQNTFSVSGKYVSSSGLFNSIAATKWIATQMIHHNSEDIEAKAPVKPKTIDYFELLMHSSFDWIRTNMALYLYPGVSELGLASALETYARSFGARVVTISETRSPIRSLHGLTLIPTLGVEQTPLFDFLLVPHGIPQQDPLLQTHTQRMLKSQSFLVKNFSTQSADSALKDHLQILAKTKGVKMANAVQRFLQVDPLIELPFQKQNFLWIRPLLLMILGALLSRLLIRLFSKPSRQS